MIESKLFSVGNEHLSNTNHCLRAYLSKWVPPILKAPLRFGSSLTIT